MHVSLTSELGRLGWLSTPIFRVWRPEYALPPLPPYARSHHFTPRKIQRVQTPMAKYMALDSVVVYGDGLPAPADTSFF